MITQSFLFASEPEWFEHRKGHQHQLPDPVQSWVYEAGSLTRRLRDFYGPQVAVTILHHRWHRPFIGERRQLHLPLYRYCLVREVMLHNHGKPLLLARTILPEETIKVAHRNLSHLGIRPLGEVIFSYPDLERVAMDLALVKAQTWMPKAQQQAGIENGIWGRRTVYAIQKQPMLVSEFFLPEILGHLAWLPQSLVNY